MTDLLHLTDAGLYCTEGDFYIDPWRPVERAVITHAHSDHCRAGSKHYLTTVEGEGVLRRRTYADSDHFDDVQRDIPDSYGRPTITTLDYGEPTTINGVRVSLHPAGHLLGSAQVRVEQGGEVWVVSGDYKVQADATCTPFEPVRCHTFITESTFGLPIYKWQPQQEIFDEINGWWRENQASGRISVLYAYALGKAQRVMSGLDPSVGPILVHGSVAKLNDAYAKANIELPPWQYADDEVAKATRKSEQRPILIAPPGSNNNPAYLRKFGPASHAFASGWMSIRGARRRRAVDRGFVLSDHADWNGLLASIEATGAENIGVTHGYSAVLVRYLWERGYNARVYETRFTGEEGEEE